MEKIDLSSHQPLPEHTSLVPKSIVSKFRAAPVRVDEETAVFAVAEPLGDLEHEALQRMVSQKIEYVQADLNDLIILINQHFDDGMKTTLNIDKRSL